MSELQLAIVPPIGYATNIIMENYCEHTQESDNDDDKLLLDDENTNATGACDKCRRRSNSANGYPKALHSSILVGNHLEDVFIGNMDVTLINSQYTDSETAYTQDFHCHAKIPCSDEHHKNVWKKLVSVSFLCFLFMIAELFGGYLAGSLAVMTDAAHLFSDLIGFCISLISIWIGQKPATRIMTFGYYRVEVLGAFLSVLAVWLLAAVFCILAIGRLIKRDFQIEPNAMLIVASIGVCINILMGAVLHGLCHTHSHGARNHSHHENINIRAAAAHVLGDLLQSVGVLISAIIIKVFPEAQVADPICTLLFSVIVVYSTLKVAYDAMKILIEASPRPVVDFDTLLMNIPGVRHVHSIHIWSLAPGKDAFTAHLAVDQSCDRDTVLKQATCVVRSRINAVFCTIQSEKYNEELISSCSQCGPYS